MKNKSLFCNGSESARNNIFSIMLESPKRIINFPIMSRNKVLINYKYTPATGKLLAYYYVAYKSIRHEK